MSRQKNECLVNVSPERIVTALRPPNIYALVPSSYSVKARGYEADLRMRGSKVRAFQVVTSIVGAIAGRCSYNGTSHLSARKLRSKRDPLLPIVRQAKWLSTFEPAINDPGAH
jgi:hypothetical protein